MLLVLISLTWTSVSHAEDADPYAAEASPPAEAYKEPAHEEVYKSTEKEKEESKAVEYNNTFNTPEKSYQTGSTSFKDNVWIFGGINAGSASVTEASGGERQKAGYHFGVKAVGSYYHEAKWVFDLGIGYFTNHMSSKGNKVKVYTNAGMLEVSPRYRITPHFQVGPVFNLLMGSDVSFSELIGGLDTGSAVNLLGGVRTQYEFNVDHFIFRLGCQAQAALTTPSRFYWTVQSDVQFGFPILPNGRSPF